MSSHEAKNRETMSWDSEKENAAGGKQNSRNDATLTSCVPKETMSLKMKANTQSMKCLNILVPVKNNSPSDCVTFTLVF